MTHFVDNVYLDTVTCYKCQMVFAMPQDFVRRRQNDHEQWFCPAGHAQIYTAKNEAQKLREEIERKDIELVNKNVQLADTRSRLSRVARAHTKMRTRIVNGVCPCCNRTFQNLMRHMRTEHADFTSNKALYALRTAFGLTQADVAKEIHVSAGTISLYENGKKIGGYSQGLITEWIERHDAEATT